MQHRMWTRVAAVVVGVVVAVTTVFGTPGAGAHEWRAGSTVGFHRVEGQGVRGTVKSDRPWCVSSSRRVELYRIVDGERVFVADALMEEEGIFYFFRNLPEGDYFVVALPKSRQGAEHEHVCTRARSVTKHL